MGIRYEAVVRTIVFATVAWVRRPHLTSHVGSICLKMASLPSGGFSTGFSSFPASTQRPTFQISIQIQRQKKKHHLEEVPLLKSETISIFKAIEYAILGKIPL